MDLIFKNVTLYQPSATVKSGPKSSRKNSLQNLFKYNKNSSDTIIASPSLQSNKNNHNFASNNRKILDNISGFAKAGQLLGVLGPSGSGKTSLLNILSGRLQPNQGCVTLDGVSVRNKQIRRKICYVLQNDVFFPDLTLKQTLMYTARLRLPDSMNSEQKIAHVKNVIQLLDLENCQNTIIGGFLRRGLSGGEKKRANIACELLSNPSVMLLDEPTSGLDSATALRIIKFLKDYAMKERKTVVITIHQPSSQIFYLFNELLLLSTGKLAYFGDVDKVVPFFEKIGFTIAPNYNPADFMIEKIRGPDEELQKIIKAAEELDKSFNISLSRRSTASGCSINFFSQKPNAKHTSHNRNYHDNYENQHNRDCMTKESGSQYDADHESESGKDVYFLISNGRKLMDDISESESEHHPWTSQTTNDVEVAKDIHYHNSHQQQQQHHHRHHHHHHHHTHHSHHHCQHSGSEHGDGLKSVELRVVIDPTNKKMQKIYNKIMPNHDEIHDDSGRSSWTETDRCSTSTFSSTCLSSRCSSTSKIYDTDCKWPTTFWTQLKVLTYRNYNESQGRLLSKLNWIQIISLALITGILWFQVPRTDASVNDIRGWMFFASSYWMMFALFSPLASIPHEKEVINKERASGAYRLSAYYLAKIVGELPATITLPTAYHFISYPMFSCYSWVTFLLQWAFLLLDSIVAQTIGFVIGVTSNDLQVSVTISALYSMTTNLFGGFYSTAIPGWLSWVKYLSIVHYAFHNMQIIEFTYGPPISCSQFDSPFSFCVQQNSTKNILLIPPNVILKHLESSYTDPFPIWLNTLILVAFLISFQIFGYLILKWFRKPE